MPPKNLNLTREQAKALLDDLMAPRHRTLDVELSGTLGDAVKALRAFVKPDPRIGSPYMVTLENGNEIGVAYATAAGWTNTPAGATFWIGAAGDVFDPVQITNPNDLIVIPRSAVAGRTAQGWEREAEQTAARREIRDTLRAIASGLRAADALLDAPEAEEAPEAECGYWILMEREHNPNLAIGPYESSIAVGDAMETSALVERFAAEDCTDCYFRRAVPPDGYDTLLIDPTNPDHYGATK